MPGASRVLAFVLAAVGAVLLTACGSGADEAPSVTAGAPGTDVWVADLLRAGDRLRLGTPVNVTRRPGYDNQPAFTADGRGLLHTSIRGEQADIYRAVFEADGLTPDTIERVTTTLVSEFSPQARPDRRITVVRVEPDGRQRLWQYSAFGQPVAAMLPVADSVGYYAWFNTTTVALFTLGTPIALQQANVRTRKLDTLAANVGASVQPIPGAAAVSYIQVQPDSSTVLHRYDLETGTSRKIAPTPASGRGVDHAWAPDGTVFMAEARILYALPPGGATWTSVDTLSVPGSLSRLAVSPSGDRIALVAGE